MNVIMMKQTPELSSMPNSVVVVASDTDIFVLLVHVYDQIKTDTEFLRQWYMKIDHKRYVNVSSICNFYGTEVCTRIIL